MGKKKESDFKKQDIARKKATRRFWKEVLPKYNAIISEVVFGELERTPDKEQRIKFLRFIESLRRIKHMLKYPSPIEQDLDKLRDNERAKQGLQELDYSPKPSSFGVARDKGKTKYKTR